MNSDYVIVRSVYYHYYVVSSGIAQRISDPVVASGTLDAMVAALRLLESP